MQDRAEKLRRKEAEDKKLREERKAAYQKKKIEDGFGKPNQVRKKVRPMEDWNNFNVDEELERIEDEDRRCRGLDDSEIRNEKILEIMQDQNMEEKTKMEKCMHMVGHQDYVHVETEEARVRRESQDLINKMYDPRYQAREKMHYLHEAYNKYNPNGFPDKRKPEV